MTSVKKHLKRLGIIYTVYGWILFSITLLAGGFLIQDLQRLRGCEQELNQPLILPEFFRLIIGMIVAYFFASVFFILFGKALKKGKAWATRIAGFIIGVLSLFSFPIGTAIGIYTLWVLTKLNHMELMKTTSSIHETRHE